jgi:hypothetical protein
MDLIQPTLNNNFICKPCGAWVFKKEPPPHYFYLKGGGGLGQGRGSGKEKERSTYNKGSKGYIRIEIANSKLYLSFLNRSFNKSTLELHKKNRIGKKL